MNLCDECQTAAHCLRNGCIPIQPAPEPAPKPGDVVSLYFGGKLVQSGLVVKSNINGRVECEPLRFPEILPNLLPTKETTA